MLTKRQSDIVSDLLHYNTWVSSAVLSQQLGISVRTLKSEVKIISTLHPTLITSGKSGYKIDASQARELLHTQENSRIPQTYEERKDYILKTVLLDSQASFDDLYRALCISSSTLKNELNKIRSELSDSNLFLHIKKDMVFITGSDRAKRAVLLQLINKELEHSMFSFESIQRIFPSVNLSQIRTAVTDILSAHEFFLDDYALINYLLHIALILASHSSRSATHRQISREINLDASKKQIADEIYQKVCFLLPLTPSLDDFYEASALMLTRITYKAREDYPAQESMDERFRELLNQIVQDVNFNYGIDLNNSRFLIPFSYHVRNLLFRLQDGLKLTALQFREFKYEYPLLYSISVFVSQRIAQYAGKNIPECEIVYIALHIGTILEEQNLLSNKLCCVVFAPNYYSIGERLGNQLTRLFPDNIYICNVVTSADQLYQESSVDLVFYVSSAPFQAPYQVLNVHPFLTEDDIHNCFHRIEEIKLGKKRQQFADKINYLIRPDFFYLNQGFKDKNQVIHKLCADLLEAGYTNEDFEHQIYERERIASSAFGRIAIPHPLSNDAKRSIIVVLIEKNGIAWDKETVQVTFMLSLRNQDHSCFFDIFDFITNIIQDPSLFRKLSHVESYEEFIEFLLSID